MRRCALPLLAALVLVLAVHAAAGDDWWNPAWACRKRVRVRFPEGEPLGFFYRKAPDAAQPVAAIGEDLVPVEVRIQCEDHLKTSPAKEIRVVDAGGNLLPCLASGPDGQGLVTVVFPARHTIEGTLAAPIQDGTETVGLAVGRDKAVAEGTRFLAMAGPKPIATLEVVAVEAKTSTARVLDRSVPSIAQGTPVRSAVLTDAEYCIYYGNPAPEGPSPTYAPPSAVVTQYGWAITSGGPPTSVPMLQAAMQASPTFAGTHAHTQIASTANPLSLGAGAYYLSAYESLIHCELTGLYRFSIDSGGPAFLFVDGRLAAERPGFFHQTGQFEHRGKIHLERGWHRLLLCATESGKLFVTRLAWQPVTGTVFNLMRPDEGVFVSRAGAEAVAYETRDERQQAFFTASPSPRSLLAEKGRRYQFVQFHNLGSLGDGEAKVTHLWDFGDGEESHREAPGHLFALPEGQRSAAFTVTLRTSVGGELAGKYTRTLHLAPRPEERFMVAVDIVSFANIVYADERTSIAVRVRNPRFGPVVLRVVGRITHGEQDEILLNRNLQIDGLGESFCILPVDPQQLPETRAAIRVDFLLGPERVATTAARLIPSPEGLAQLEPRLGALYDAEGNRIMICAEREDRDRHLQWVFVRYLRDVALPRHTGARRRILLFGDRMANPVGPEESFTDYVTLLQSRLEEEGRSFQFVPRAGGLLPTLGDLVEFDRCLGGLDPLPDIIVLSPGLADVAQATGERDFARTLDVMVDRIRACPHRIKVVVVSPPPFPRNPRLSRHYTRAVERVRREHHLAFLDLDKLLTRDDDGEWLADYYAIPNAENLFYQNPNEAGHRRIADAIYKLLH